MIDSRIVNSVFDAKVVDSDGTKVGTVKQIYVDREGGQPLFASVATGLFGTSESLVPLRNAVFDGDELQVGYDKSTIKDAPRIDADGDLSDDEQDRIWDYYSADAGEEDDERSEAADDTTRRSPDRTDDDGRTDGRVRLRKHIVTEQQTVTVPVQREEVIVEPISDENGPDGTPNGASGAGDRTAAGESARTGRHAGPEVDRVADGEARRDDGTGTRGRS